MTRIFPAHNRTCKTCGVSFVTQGKGQRIHYCSEACARRASSNVNRLPMQQRGAIPVGRHFVRSDDLAECVVCADARGLPYPLALREMEVQRP